MSRRWCLLRRHRGEDGYAAVLASVFIAALMLPLCAIAIDTGRIYVEAQRLQNAADAAAMAGVTFMPDDLTRAQQAARTIAQRNGFPDNNDYDVDVAPGPKPTQLRVTITSRLHNTFASGFGVSTAPVNRGALADFSGPVPMGSPCNAFGNEPATGAAETQAPGSQIVAPPGGASCTSTPQFWAGIAGPETPKGNGDGVMTRTCASGTSGCTGTKNDEFDPQGYFYVVRVGEAARNTPVTLQLFDPAWVEVTDNCSGRPAVSAGTTLRNGMNEYTTDGLTRYAQGSGVFCSGDVLNGGSEPVTTSYGLRAPTDTLRPTDGAGVDGCIKQFQGHLAAAATTGTLDSSLGTYQRPVAQVFRQWVPLCTFTPTQVGDYYLQVRTNVTLGGTQDPVGGIYSGNPAVLGQVGDNVNVKANGNNRFAIRATGPGRAAVQVSGWESMGIYANYPGARTEFNLVRVLPAAATKNLVISFFDVGDATKSGTITVLPPTESSLKAPVPGCAGTGVVNGQLVGCALTNVSTSTYNGKRQNVRVPIPNDYTCDDAELGGCWWRLQVEFPGATVNDTTTWSAKIEGDPVRLIE